VLQEVLHTSSPHQQQPASLEVQLSVAQHELVSSQQQVSELSIRLAAAEAARAALQEQLDHLGVKVSKRRGSAGGHKHMGLPLRSRYDSMITMQQV
jgi:chromosome segregation ATPase